MPYPPLPQVVAANARRIRVEVARASQAQVTDAVRALGAAWPAGRVAHIESGEAAVTVATLVLLAYALDRLSGPRPVTVADLLQTGDGDDAVGLAPGLALPAAALADVLGGGAARLVGEFGLPWETVPKSDGVPVPAMLPGGDPREATARLHYAQTDVRAARALGLRRQEMIRLAVRLWGHNLSQERDRRAADVGISKRGGKIAITRGLLAEARRAPR